MDNVEIASFAYAEMNRTIARLVGARVEQRSPNAQKIIKIVLDDVGQLVADTILSRDMTPEQLASLFAELANWFTTHHELPSLCGHEQGGGGCHCKTGDFVPLERI